MAKTVQVGVRLGGEVRDAFEAYRTARQVGKTKVIEELIQLAIRGPGAFENAHPILAAVATAREKLGLTDPAQQPPTPSALPEAAREPPATPKRRRRFEREPKRYLGMSNADAEALIEDEEKQLKQQVRDKPLVGA